MKAIAAWVQTHAAFLLLLVFGIWTGASLLRRKNNQVDSISKALEVERAKQSIEELEAQRKAMQPVDEEKANEVLQLSAQIVEHKKRIAELHAGKSWEELTDDQVRRALRDAGVR